MKWKNSEFSFRSAVRNFRRAALSFVWSPWFLLCVFASFTAIRSFILLIRLSIKGKYWIENLFCYLMNFITFLINKMYTKIIHQRPNKSKAEESMHLCKTHEYGKIYSLLLLLYIISNAISTNSIIMVFSFRFSLHFSASQLITIWVYWIHYTIQCQARIQPDTFDHEHWFGVI